MWVTFNSVFFHVSVIFHLVANEEATNEHADPEPEPSSGVPSSPTSALSSSPFGSHTSPIQFLRQNLKLSSTSPFPRCSLLITT